MDYLSSGNRYASLSLADLLAAREQFHAHLVHKQHVVATAIGRYLIRRADPFPGRAGAASAERAASKPPRTLENSEVREYSWPCVLVFVDEWIDESQFGRGELAASDFVPKTIYMPDGKAVPVCVVLAQPAATPPPRRPAPELDPTRLQGGYPILSDTQHVRHRATVGCLLTDGHKVYAVTARHAAGELGERVLSEAGAPVGTASSLHLSRVPFESVYAPWPGRQAFVNLDVALIEVDDMTVWSSGIESVGPIGPLAALSTYNLSLNIIGCPVRAHGAATGPMTGAITALFYRYKSVGGFDYVADFLIGSRTAYARTTLPGDSGAVWVVDLPTDKGERNRPIAVQWGGTMLGGLEQQTTFALASNLSTICRELNVDVYRGPSVAAFEYWGYEGHKAIGQFAAGLVQNVRLHTLLTKNRSNLGTLANFPDTLWKNGQRPHEGPNHYADVDLSRPGIPSLEQQTPNAASIDPDIWRTYYTRINANPDINGKVSAGLLPFRIAQIFRALKADIVPGGDTEEIVAAMGILAHYVGDACQPLHSTYLTNGDPFRFPNGHPSPKMRGLGKGFGGGVHSAYETGMIFENLDDLRSRVENALAPPHAAPALIDTGREAAWETLELMRRARATLDPMEVVEFYAENKGEPDVNARLWAEFGTRTVETMVDGCRVLAMLWDSVWSLGDGDAIAEAQLTWKQSARLRDICKVPGFLPSLRLADIGPEHLE